MCKIEKGAILDKEINRKDEVMKKHKHKKKISNETKVNLIIAIINLLIAVLTLIKSILE